MLVDAQCWLQICVYPKVMGSMAVRPSRIFGVVYSFFTSRKGLILIVFFGKRSFAALSKPINMDCMRSLI